MQSLLVGYGGLVDRLHMQFRCSGPVPASASTMLGEIELLPDAHEHVSSGDRSLCQAAHILSSQRYSPTTLWH